MTYQRQGPIAVFLLNSPDFFCFLCDFCFLFNLTFVCMLFVSHLRRRTSELLLAGLSCSFILASGIVKDFGWAVMGGVVAQWWAKSVKDGCLQLWGCIFSLCSSSQSGFSTSSLSPLNLISWAVRRETRWMDRSVVCFLNTFLRCLPVLCGVLFLNGLSRLLRQLSGRNFK